MTMNELEPEFETPPSVQNVEEQNRSADNLGQQPKLKLTIASLMFLTVLCAIGARWPILVGFLTPVIPLLVIGLGTKFRFNWNRYLVILAAVYLPALQGFVDKGTHCRNMWPELFTVAPTFVPGMIVARSAMFSDDDLATAIAGLAMAAVISGLYLFAPAKKFALAAILVFVAIASSISVNFLIMVLHA